MKKKKEIVKGTIPITYEKINPSEAGVKVHNIILCYPFNPLKVDFLKVPWLGGESYALEKPFCGLIEQCHREGFIIYPDWLMSISRIRSGFYRDDVQKIREKIIIHLKDLIIDANYKKEAQKIVVNNQFKELDSWLNKMYKKLSQVDRMGGWDKAYYTQINRKENILKAYKQYRKMKENRLEDVITKYKNELEQLGPPPVPKIKPYKQQEYIDTNVFSYRRRKFRKVPKNLSERERLLNKFERYEYNEQQFKHKSRIEIPLRSEFQETFFMYHTDFTKENIFTSKEFEDQINEIFRLLGNEWMTMVNGKLMLLGTTAEEIEEILTFKILEDYKRIVKNLRKAHKNIKDADWDDVPLYCCKAIEGFYKALLKNKKEYEDKTLSQLTAIIREQKDMLFKESIKGVKGGLDHLILSALNLVGSIRNRRDSGHYNITNVPEWEAKMSYSFTLLLLRTLYEFKF